LKCVLLNLLNGLQRGMAMTEWSTGDGQGLTKRQFLNPSRDAILQFGLPALRLSLTQ
jgi:hypothetical protein